MVRVFDRVIIDDNSDKSKKEVVVDLSYNQANNALLHNS